MDVASQGFGGHSLRGRDLVSCLGNHRGMWGLEEYVLELALYSVCGEADFKYGQRREFEDGRVLVSDIYYVVVSMEGAVRTLRLAFADADADWLDQAAEDLRSQYASGVAMVRAFSQYEPLGEYGFARYGEMLQITEERYSEALQSGWIPGPLEPHHCQAPGFYGPPAPKRRPQKSRHRRLLPAEPRNIVHSIPEPAAEELADED